MSRCTTRRLSLVAGACMMLAGCSPADLSDNSLTEDAKVSEDAVTSKRLKRLPLPADPIVLAVYAFEDKTGQHKPSDDFPEFSRAVTQGGGAILNKALYDAGNGGWFRVLEREGLNNLVQERKIIRATRLEYSPNNTQSADVGPLLYAGMLLEGGIVAYDANVVTGGIGARYLGVGGDTQYRRDIVTVALRGISVRTGEVILAVNTSKTIFSTVLRGGINKFIAVDELLEVETGFSLNEAPQYAVRQAIEMAVYSMVMEGAIKGLWGFQDAREGQRAIRDYLTKRDRLDEDDDEALASSPLGNPGIVNTPPALPAARRPDPAPQPAPMQAQTPPRGDAPILPPQQTLIRRPAVPAPPKAPVVQQLPADATSNSPTNGLTDAVKPSAEDPQNIEVFRPYPQQGVVYCGPSGCVPAYEGAR